MPNSCDFSMALSYNAFNNSQRTAYALAHSKYSSAYTRAHVVQTGYAHNCIRTEGTFNH